MTCVRGKEKQAVGELYDLFEQYAAQLWPEQYSAAHITRNDDGSSEEAEEDEDIEKQIAMEMSTMKRPRKDTRFGMLYVYGGVSTC